MKARFLLAALAGAFVAVMTCTSPCAADDLVPSVSVQTGATFIRSPVQDGKIDDYFVAATPALTYFIDGERTLYSITYAFTGSLNSELPNSVANSLALATATDVGPNTRLLFGASALQSLLGNYLLVRRSADTRIGGLNNLNTSLLTVQGTEGIAHDFTPVLRLNQGITATYFTSLDPEVELSNFVGVANVGMARSWEFDAVGGELSVQYAKTRAPPFENTAFTFSAGPTWDHDLSRTVTLSLAASVQVAISPDENTKTLVGPQGSARLSYLSEGYGLAGSYNYGVEPNPLLGTLFQAHQAEIRGVMPISTADQIFFGVSAGYLQGTNLDLTLPRGGFNNRFEAVLHDADLTWGATEFLALFLRYQFIGQGSGEGIAASPAIVRHAGIFGIDIFGARRAVRQRARVPSRFPQRVDGSDGRGGGGAFGMPGAGGAGGAGGGGAGGGGSGR